MKECICRRRSMQQLWQQGMVLREDGEKQTNRPSSILSEALSSVEICYHLHYEFLEEIGGVAKAMPGRRPNLRNKGGAFNETLKSV